ncbi:Penicillin-binding protein 1A [Streptomyces sp. RB5]|uniref:Penicillin-binding protein 1A n=1 Tax=Streptomyces smaragdinus TaxID=2585196 RepID=A0A7K0CIW2_9ACTN|nr:transglycosylase domain-containing protein [Streptomyces smaragdinus]MQY13351.1 Penicillin-binding protein 1A [Streptomyces smaragdinus]
MSRVSAAWTQVRTAARRHLPAERLRASAGRLPAGLLRRLRPHYPRPGVDGRRRWIPSWRQSLCGFLLVVGLLTGAVTIAYSQTDIPEDLNSFATQQDNVFYWSDGSKMSRTGWVSRQDMPLEKVPEDVRWAVLAAENAGFYDDPGISISGMTRALTRMVGGGDTQGGSTITQQYVKNVYLSQNQTMSRKFTEMLLALKVDEKFSKDEILEGYLNTSWFGRGTYGIQRAAQAYYGKEATDLNASEGAFLASLLKGAGQYDPALGPKNHERAVARWAWTLDRMVEIGKLSPAERATYKNFPEPTQATGGRTDLSGQRGYLVELAKAYVTGKGKISEAEFDRGGYQIYTTFDKKKTEALEAAVRKARKKLSPKDRKSDTYVKTGATTVGPDGRIIAVYGGPGFLKQGFNESNAVTVPAGSAFTPFVYAAALNDGIARDRSGVRYPVTPYSTYNGQNKASVMTPEGPYWDRNGKIVRAKNDGGLSWGENVTLRQAMVHSVNGPFLQLGMDVGLDRVRRHALQAGLLPSSLGSQVPAFALGNSTPSAIRMASAYGTFAAGGRHTDPYSVLKVTRNGERLPLPEVRTRRVYGADVAREVTESLRAVVEEGTGQAARSTGLVPAGKTGTTPDNRAAWFIGSAGEETTAVVLYRMDLRKLALMPLDGTAGTAGDELGNPLPADIWRDYSERFTLR